MRRVCFVTGTRAEFGLMQSTLLAIRGNPFLELQIIATGMHLSAAHGQTVRQIRADGWTIDAEVKWPVGRDENQNAIHTGRAMAGIASAIARLNSDFILIVGDRVEAFAAAAAGHIAGKIVAHVHGGDRALGQVDDALRHSITKLAHLHFPATQKSKERILRMGEDPWRVHRVGSPGIDGIAANAIGNELPRFSFALLVLHPTDADETAEYLRAKLLLESVLNAGLAKVVIIYPNNDPGSAGIIRCWKECAADAVIYSDVPRAKFLGFMRDAAVLVGNSSSGMIEAASFGTPVVNVGPRQHGREHSGNYCNVPFARKSIEYALLKIWNHGKPIRFDKKNAYGGDGAGRRIAEVLAKVRIDQRLRRKLISY